jgi:putative ABC transport system ATP-binding protein
MTLQPNVVFRITDLSKTYHMGEVDVLALQDVSLEIRKGELLVILGASGSGKSTLLNILGGLDGPTTGEVSYLDHQLTSATDKELTSFRREHVGFVFQFYNLIPSLTALENVQLVTDIAQDPMDPEEALKIVELGHRIHHFPSQLSGGEQQRIAIARAIAKKPVMSRPARSITRPARSCSRPSSVSTENSGRRPRSLRITLPLQAWPIARSICRAAG